jgi:O-acetyl-ADP-ribose deacetylase (regulator of RNase III)
LIEKHGDVFTTKATYIGHGVNCQGVMGAGIAKTIKDKFPKNFAEYKKFCDEGIMVPGVYGAYAENGKVIVNLATQDYPGADAKYEHVFKSLYYFAQRAGRKDTLALHGNKVAVPEIGCGIGGLEWPKVKAIVQCVESMVPTIEFEVWHYK